MIISSFSFSYNFYSSFSNSFLSENSFYLNTNNNILLHIIHLNSNIIISNILIYINVSFALTDSNNIIKKNLSPRFINFSTIVIDVDKNNNEELNKYSLINKNLL